MVNYEERLTRSELQLVQSFIHKVKDPQPSVNEFLNDIRRLAIRTQRSGGIISNVNKAI